MTSDNRKTVSVSGLSSSSTSTSTSKLASGTSSSGSDSENGGNVVTEIPLMGDFTDSSDSEPAAIPDFDLIECDDSKNEQVIIFFYSVTAV